ncbi:uncharacterized protein LOC134182755 [Corticium candelabrum]|uniref:uncharacterized protein LOC134182755 n=1 Tax=Corticium candelabrum TaxID=121492 RepID=UPI002E276C49|nr:uncharacterized protein LOC134182755 [Corticium candelabrum]
MGLGKPNCSETCFGFWTFIGKGVNSGRVCNGVHLVVVKNQNPSDATYSECRGLQVVVTLEEGSQYDDNKTLNEQKFQSRGSKWKGEEKGLLAHLSDVWKQRLETLKNGVAHYRDSADAKQELQRSLSDFMRKRTEFLTKVVNNTKPIEKLQTTWQFVEAVWKSKRDK